MVNLLLRVGFDPDLFFEGNKTYLSTASSGSAFVEDPGYFAILKTEIDISTGDSLTDTELFHVSTLPLDAPRLAEGSHLYKKDDWWYLMTAEGGTDAKSHRVMIKRSKDGVNGIWEENPNNPILWNGKNLFI